MRKLRVGVMDLVTKGPTKALYARLMHANLAGIMSQVVGVWCEQDGHDVTHVCYTGFEDLEEAMPSDADIVFITAFSQAAQLAMAISSYLRSKGVVTVLGGPHARCYPEDAVKYFDYVVGFTDHQLVRDILADCSQHRPVGVHLQAAQQPAGIPGVRERWKFIESTLEKAPFFKIVPMIGSLGCPYTCSFCIDSEVKYQPLDFGQMTEDLKFLLTKLDRPIVGWHDPNFGVRFDEYMDAIEEAVPPGRMDFAAESSLALLSEDHLKRLQKNGFAAMLPGVESWYEVGNKSKSGAREGMDKVLQVSEHINMIMRYLPYTQSNFVLGLDSDSGTEPFELTKRFVDLAPGTFPGYSLLSAFGRAAPLNLNYQRANRVLAFPFHFLNNNHAMNVKPANYSWREFYDNVIDLTKYTFSRRAIWNRFRANNTRALPRWLNVVRAISSEGFGRIKYHTEIRRRLDSDPQFEPFFEGQSTRLPDFYRDRVKNDLGPLWKWLPEGSLEHDPNAYLKVEEAGQVTKLRLGREVPAASA